MTNEIKKYKIKILDDQFSSVTRAVRRNLLIISSIVILLTVKGVKFNTLFGIDLKELLSNKLAIGAISLVIIYELLTFITYAIIDHRQWSSKAKLDFLEYSNKTIDSYFMNGISPLGQPIIHMPVFDDPNHPDKENHEAAFQMELGQFKNVISQSKDIIDQYNEQLDRILSDVNKTNYLQLFRIYIIDWSFPIFAGIFALMRSQEYILKFWQAMFT